VTTLIIVIVIAVVLLGGAAFLAQRKKRESEIAQAEAVRAQAADQARSTLPDAQDRAAEAEAQAAEARASAERAEAEARAAQVEAAQVEAEHEAQVRDADRIDPRVDHKSDDYEPQVAGTADQQPTPPSEANLEPEPAAESRTETTTETPADTPTDTPAEQRPADQGPTLPRRTPGAQEMPGKPIERTDGGGGWFSKDPDKS
jgi:FtsZ-interacting cell division protein ZipA